MKYFVGVVLGIIFLLIIVLRYKRVKNIFDPLIIAFFLQFLRYSLPLIALSEEDFFGYTIYYSDNSALMLLLYELVFISFSLLPFCFRKKKKSVLAINQVNDNINYCFKRKTAIIVFTIGMLAKIYVILRLGGLFYVITHMSESYSKQSSGFGYISLLYGLMLVAILLELQRYKQLRSKKDLIVAILMSIIYMGSYLVYSSRGPAFQLILIWVCFFAIYNKSFSIKKLFSPLFLAIGIIVVALSMTIVNLRNSGNSLTQYDSILLMIEGMIKEFSRAGRDMYCYTEMSNVRWYGKIYLNLFYMVLPSNIVGNKPPLDDGLYLVNIMQGHYYSPNTSRFDMEITNGSIPFTTQGLLFVNFGFLGVAVGGIITGLVLKSISDHFYGINRKNTFFFTYLFFYFCFMLQLTPLLISSFITNVLVFLPFAAYANYKGIIRLNRFKKKMHNRQITTNSCN